MIVGAHRHDPMRVMCEPLSAVIHFIVQAVPALAALARPSHVLVYAPGDSLLCRLDTA